MSDHSLLVGREGDERKLSRQVQIRILLLCEQGVQVRLSPHLERLFCKCVTVQRLCVQRSVPNRRPVEPALNWGAEP